MGSFLVGDVQVLFLQDHILFLILFPDIEDMAGCKAVGLRPQLSQTLWHVCRTLFANVSFCDSEHGRGQTAARPSSQVQHPRESVVYVRAARDELLAARGLCQSTERQAVRQLDSSFL